MANFGIGKIVSILLVAIVVVAIWKVNNGDLSRMVDAVWTFVNWGADMVTNLWEKFVASGDVQEAVDNVTQ